MTARNPDVSEIYLEPGESRLVRKASILKTILGSCVGIAFRVPRLGIGALCHPMMPICSMNPASQLNPRAGRRYVDFAIRELAAKFDVLGAERKEVEVKLFGGADVLSTRTRGERQSVGRMNRDTALRVLEEEGFVVQASSLGGRTGVHIEFHTGTGEVLLRRLQHTPSSK